MQQTNNRIRKIRQDVLRALKMTRLPKSNLTGPQQRALKEIKRDEKTLIYPFDKGPGLVRIDKDDALQKIKDQMGPTKIVSEDPTSKILGKVQRTLRKIKGKFTEKEYKGIYPSNAVPPRLYGVIKAHKPEKNYSMRLIVSTIGTATYETSKFLVNLIQPTLNKNKVRLKNSTSFKEEAEN